MESDMVHTRGETEVPPWGDGMDRIINGYAEKIWYQASKILLLEETPPVQCPGNIWEPGRKLDEDRIMAEKRIKESLFLTSYPIYTFFHAHVAWTQRAA